MNKISNRTFTILTVSAVVLFGVVLYGSQNGWFSWKREVADNEQQEPGEEVVPEGFIKWGDVTRPEHDVIAKNDRKREEPKDTYHPGLAPLIPTSTNASTESLGRRQFDDEASKANSGMQVPEPFDLEEYEKDPQAYLDEVVAGRIWQPATPSADIAKIKRIGRFSQSVVQGESVFLEVKATAGMPVHFSSDRLGEFDNRLSTISVMADENGRARVKFTLSSGTRDFVDVMASSPVHSGFARWLIEVVKPETKTKNQNN